MSENNNEQMNLGNGTTNNKNTIDTNKLSASSKSKVTTTENTISKLKLTIKTPKEKKRIYQFN